jgi:ABC-type multidrug transport system fused ATPase/permease subunit
MFQRIGRGWGIAKASWAVVKLHPKLLLLPIFSGFAFMLLMAAIGLSVFAGSKSDYMRHLLETQPPDQPIVYVAMFAFYFACTFIIVFFNAALIFCALQSFAGKEPSLRAGLATAAGRLPQILAWTFVAATVGLILNALQSFLKDKLGFVGALLGGLAETAWAVVTYFVVPVVVVDGVGPIEAVKRSSAILRRTWGEAIGGEGGLGLISFIFFLPVVLLFGVFGTAGIGVWASPPLAIALIAVVAVYLLALVVVFTALGTIFRTGTYVYATTGQAPSNMDPALLQAAFRKKES